MIDLDRVLHIIRGCSLEDAGGLSSEGAAVAMKQIILGAVRGLMEAGPAAPKPMEPALRKEWDDARDEAERGMLPVAPKRKTSPVKRIYAIPNDAVCRRGEQLSDKTGQPFAHVVAPEGYCIFCNAGLPPPKTEPDPGANIYEHGGEEKVWCTEHGFHMVRVNPDGTFKDTPDCAMFKVQEQR